MNRRAANRPRIALTRDVSSAPQAAKAQGQPAGPDAPSGRAASKAAGVSSSGPATPPAERHAAPADTFTRRSGPAPKPEQASLGSALARTEQELGRLDPAKVAALDADSVGQWTASLYLMQHRLIGALNSTAAADAGMDLKQRALKALQRVGDVQSQLFERAVSLSDAQQEAPVKPWMVFRNTLKDPERHSQSERHAYFADKLKSFIRSGGDVAQIQSVSKDALLSARSGALFEWAVDAYDTARMSRADGDVTPGHTLLAWGEDVLAAGSMRVFKDAEGDIGQVVLGTFSGHFRSNAQFLHHMARHLVAAGVEPEKIVMHAGEAGTPRGLELVYGALGRDGDAAQRAVAKLEQQAARLNPRAPLAEPDQKTGGAEAAATAGAAAGQSAGAPKQGAPAPENAGEQAPAPDVADALFAMEQAASRALKDGVVLEAGVGEATDLVARTDAALTAAQRAGDPQAFGRARALLQHLAQLETPHVDADARAVFAQAAQRWADAEAVQAGADPGRIFGPTPVAERKTRIVATLDPDVSQAELQKMIAAGMDTARLNIGHSTPDALRRTIGRIRDASAALGRDVGVQVDLAGPKVRLGEFENPNNLEYNDIFLTAGETVSLTTEKTLGNPELLPVGYEGFAQDVEPGHRILMNDGRVELRVTESDPQSGRVRAKVVRGGKVWDHKGMNLPDTKLGLPTITERDTKFLDALLPHVDTVAASFVRSPQDVAQLRQMMQERGRHVPIVAKIEQREGLENLEAIAAVADGLMVARGDLGVELGYENVPPAEREINAVGNRLGKPVMVATEVLSSMVDQASRPSRGDAEAVYSAVIDQGAEAFMLGKATSYPEHAGDVVRAASHMLERFEHSARESLYRQARAPMQSGSPLAVRAMQADGSPKAAHFNASKSGLSR